VPDGGDSRRDVRGELPIEALGELVLLVGRV